MTTEPSVAWRRASRGLYFMGFGALLLMTTLDIIDWSFWFEILAYWPLLLVAVGIRMIFERSAAPWAILLSPLLVFGTMAWVATTTPSGHAAGWGDLVADAPRELDSWTFEANVALTDIDLEARDLAPGRLVEGRISPPGERALRIRDWRGGTRVELASFRKRRVTFLIPGRSRAWDLGLAREHPMALVIQGAFTGGGVDLAAAELSRMDLDGAFHGLEFRLPRPRTDVRLNIEGAFNDIEIMVPPDTPVSVVTDGAINVVNGRSHPPSSDLPGYRLRVQGFMNHVEIVSDPDALPPTHPGRERPDTQDSEDLRHDPVAPPGNPPVPSGT